MLCLFFILSLSKQLKRIIICTMGNFSEQVEVKKETKEKEKTSRETLGKYFYDLSKLSFGAMVLGVVVPWFSDSDNPDYWILLAIGIFTTACLAFFGYKIIKRYYYGRINHCFRWHWCSGLWFVCLDIYQIG